MGRLGNIDIRNLEKFRDELNNLQNSDEFVEACARELAARLLRLVVKRTPVGDYTKEIVVTAKRDGKKHKKGEKYTKRINPSGKKGGTLKRGWTAGKSASARDYAESMRVNHYDDTYVVEIINPVEYASYVEYGHRTPNHRGWVIGKFMMTISEKELRGIAPRVLENKIKKHLRSCFK